MEKNTVCIGIDLYNVMLDYTKQHEELKQNRNKLAEQNRMLKKFLIESYIDEYKVRFHDMERITNYRDEFYFAISKENVIKLLNLGCGINEMVHYIKLKKQIMLEEENGNE